jgi:hypothetical protein
MDTSQSYASLPTAEDREQLLVNSDQGSFTIDNEKNWRSPDLTRHTLGSTLRDYWWIYTTGILILIAGLQLVVLHELRTYLSDSSRQVGGDYISKGPVCLSSRSSQNVKLDLTDMMQLLHDLLSGVPIMSMFL